MCIFNTINEDIKKAILAKDKLKLMALRAAKAAFLLAKTETGNKELSDEREIQIIQKLVKQRQDSAAIYKEQNREDLFKQESCEAEILSQYLPEQISNETLTEIIKGIITEIKADSIKDMGKVMGVATKKLAGQSDNKTISDIVKKLLS